MRALLIASCLAGCGLETVPLVTLRDDAGEAEDSGVEDSGAPDMGTPDMGTPDMGTPDMGTPDMGTPDTGVACVCRYTVCGGDDRLCEAQIGAGSTCNAQDVCERSTGTCTINDDCGSRPWMCTIDGTSLDPCP
jgi:hypothetical protein